MKCVYQENLLFSPAECKSHKIKTPYTLVCLLTASDMFERHPVSSTVPISSPLLPGNWSAPVQASPWCTWGRDGDEYSVIKFNWSCDKSVFFLNICHTFRWENNTTPEFLELRSHTHITLLYHITGYIHGNTHSYHDEQINVNNTCCVWRVTNPPQQKL